MGKHEINANATATNGAAATNNTDKRNATKDLIAILKQQRKQSSNRLSTIQKRTEKANENISFLTSMNESLVSNKESLKQRIQQAARERNETKDMLRNTLPSL